MLVQLLVTEKQNFIALSEHGQLRSGLNQMVRKRDMGRGKETGRRRSDSDRDMG